MTKVLDKLWSPVLQRQQYIEAEGYINFKKLGKSEFPLKYESHLKVCFFSSALKSYDKGFENFLISTKWQDLVN